MEPNYKEMYFKMAAAAAQAAEILIQAQQECEEMYIEAGEEPSRIIQPFPDKEP